MSDSRMQVHRVVDSLVKTRVVSPNKFPSILIEGEEASWTGDELLMFGSVHFYKNITFEAMVNNFDRKFVNLKNIGSTVIYFRWENLLPRQNFEGIKLSKPKMRFFFDPCPNVLRPGESRDILVTFFSRNAGIFREKFQLHTQPVVAGGASLLFNFKGVALSDSDTNDKIESIEADLARRQTIRFISNIISHVLNTVTSSEAKTRRRPKRATLEERFSKANPKLYFRRDVVDRLHKVYNMVYNHLGDQTTKSPRQWNFSIETLEEIFHEIQHPRKQVQDLNEVKDTLLPTLRKPPLTPFAVGPYHVVYLLWVQTVDAMVEEAAKLHGAMFPSEDDGFSQQTKRKTSRYVRLGKREPGKTPKKDPFLERIAGRMTADDFMTESGALHESMAVSKLRHSLYLSTYYLVRNLVEFMACILDDMWPVKGECYNRIP